MGTLLISSVPDAAAEDGITLCKTCFERGFVIVQRLHEQYHGAGRSLAWTRCPNEPFNGKPHERMAEAVA